MAFIGFHSYRLIRITRNHLLETTNILPYYQASLRSGVHLYSIHVFSQLRCKTMSPQVDPLSQPLRLYSPAVLKSVSDNFLIFHLMEQAKDII